MRMELQDQFYNYMLHGTKRIEIRLNDEKRRTIKLGDEITFYSALTKEEFKTKVVGLLNYKNFNDMFNDFDISVLADKDYSKDELLNELSMYYPIEKQNEYSVLGIRIELI